jgi:hypothetical protein
VRPWQRLVDLDLAVVAVLCRWLGLEAPRMRSSTLGVPGRRSERLVSLCEHLGARHYLSGDAASDYLDIPLFERHGIQVSWQHYHHPTYPQLHGPFVSHLSALDLIFNCGDESAQILRSEAVEAQPV